MSEMDKYVETFRQEADELLADIEEVVLAVEENPNDEDAINRLFRAMHTIKGSGAMFGFDDVASFTHHVETILDKVRSHELAISRELIDLVLASRDQITAMLDATNGGPEVDKKLTEQIISKLNALLPTANSQTEKEAADLKTPVQNECCNKPHKSTYKISFSPDQNIFATGMDPSYLLDDLRELGECEVTVKTDQLPSFEDINPENCYLSWDITLQTESDIDAIKDVFIFVADTSKLDISEVPQQEEVSKEDGSKLIGEILVERGDATSEDIQNALSKQKKIGEILVDSGTVSSDKVKSALGEQQAHEKHKISDRNETLRVDSDKLDLLINFVGELVINQAQITQLAARMGNTDLSMSAEELERLTDGLRDVVLNIRMMPIGTTFSRFKRLVRDLSSDLGKEIELVTEGAETELDKSVIDRLADPLVHLIRNSIDHGIEHPDERIEKGKPRKGTIRLAAAHIGTNVVVTIQDDGKGLDCDAIRKKAIEKGLLSADADVTEKEIFSQIFLPGFSTAEKVTSVSGRGVGMDVVRREIDSLRGSIDVTSKKNVGTTIDLSLPLTLAIIDGLLVDVDGGKYVIPLSTIEECLELTTERYAMSRDRNVIQVRGEAVPFIRLREVFDLPYSDLQHEEVVVVSSGNLRAGIVVDKVIGDHQTVIKSLGKVYQHVEGVSGATIMGDGEVALILDIAGLVRCARKTDEKIVVNA